MDPVKPFAVFLSHHHSDALWALRIRDVLQARGITVWLDRDRIRPGDLVIKALQDAIEQCQAFITLVSPDAITSKWVQEEYSHAIGHRSPIRIIPCWLRGAEMPDMFANRVWVDFRDESKFEAAMHSLVLGLTGNGAGRLAADREPGEAAARPARLLLPPPHPKPELVGRDKVIQHMREVLLAPERSGLLALQGMPGAGKTAIALAIAFDEAVIDRFHHDVLWVPLGREPDLLRLLGMIADKLGIAASELAELTTVRQRSERLRECLESRRALLIIDDAWRLEDALAFKLGGASSTHLLTTRNVNLALEFAETKQRVEQIAELSPKQAMSLLERYVPELVHDSADRSENLATAVGCLPLALIILGGYLRSEGAAGQKNRLRRAIERLANVQTLLTVARPLDGMAVSLWETIQLSYEVLSDPAKRLLRALSAFPSKPGTFSEAAACAASPNDFEALYSLVDGGLVEYTTPEAGGAEEDRYCLHQAIESFARKQLIEAGEIREAYQRMLDFFVELADRQVKAGTGYKAIQHESGNIRAALQGAYDAGLAGEFLDGLRSLFPYLESLGLYHVAEEHLDRAREIARVRGDVRLTALTLNASARIARKQGRYADAEQHARAGLEIGEDLPDQSVACKLLGNLGGVIANLGRYREAAGHLDRAIGKASQLESGEDVSTLLRQRGAVASNLGEFPEAEDFFRRGLAIAVEQNLGQPFARIHAFLGELEICRGRYGSAEDHLRAGLARAESIAHREVQCICLQNFGVLEAKRGQARDAARHLRKSLELARQMGHRERVTNSLAAIAWLKVESGAWKEAAKAIAEAHAMARAIGHARRLAFLHVLASRIAMAEGRFDHAEEGLAEALQLAQATEHWWNVSTSLLAQGELALLRRRLGPAREAFSSLLQRSHTAGAPELIAAALFGQARVAAGEGDLDQARAAGAESLGRFESMPHRTAPEVRRWLTELG